MKTMRFKNFSNHLLNLAPIGLGTVAPGAEADVPLALAAPGRGDNGARTKSAIESCAPQMMPSDAREREAWLAAPPASTTKPKLVASVGGRLPPLQGPDVRALREAVRAAKAGEQ